LTGKSGITNPGVSSAVCQAGYDELDLWLENGSERCTDENVRYENAFYLKSHIIIEAYEKMPQ